MNKKFINIIILLMKLIKILSLMLLNGCDSFIPNNVIFKRKKMLRMSHFSTVKTMIKDKDILIKSLEDLNVVVSESEQYVKDYNGNEVLVDVCIEQENDNNIGFVLNDDSYELVADLQYWEQSVPVDVFLARLTQKYSINIVVDTLKEEGYDIDNFNIDENTEFCEIDVSRYNY
jgi:hypothetical protein